MSYQEAVGDLMAENGKLRAENGRLQTALTELINWYRQPWVTKSITVIGLAKAKVAGVDIMDQIEEARRQTDIIWKQATDALNQQQERTEKP